MVFDLQELFGQDVSEMCSQKPVVGLLDTVDFLLRTQKSR